MPTFSIRQFAGMRPVLCLMAGVMAGFDGSGVLAMELVNGRD
ncbi:hypothetical protein [Cupriavidus sp.]|nr:hypothetical protein [Cupriavidus sp.]